MQLYSSPFYNTLGQQNNFEWTTEHQTRFEEISYKIPDPDQQFYAM